MFRFKEFSDVEKLDETHMDEAKNPNFSSQEGNSVALVDEIEDFIRLGEKENFGSTVERTLKEEGNNEVSLVEEVEDFIRLGEKENFGSAVERTLKEEGNNEASLVEEVEGINEYMAQQERKGLCAKLDQISHLMPPTQERKEEKRKLVYDFRRKYPDKKAGR